MFYRLLAGKMFLTEHKKANVFSHTIMADVKNGNQQLHFSDILKYSENTSTDNPVMISLF